MRRDCADCQRAGKDDWHENEHSVSQTEDEPDGYTTDDQQHRLVAPEWSPQSSSPALRLVEADASICLGFEILYACGEGAVDGSRLPAAIIGRHFREPQSPLRDQPTAQWMFAFWSQYVCEQTIAARSTCLRHDPHLSAQDGTVTRL